LERGLAKLGLTVRGMYGEGSENLGNFYQISNQSTLGESEYDIMKHLSGVIDQVITHEENSRSKLLDHHRNRLLDKVGRAFGTLRYSYILSAKEAFKSLSGVRLGVDMKMFRSVDIHTVNDLFLRVQTAHLQKYSERELEQGERDAVRAAVLRQYFQDF
jgi:protein arginine kinase